MELIFNRKEFFVMNIIKQTELFDLPKECFWEVLSYSNLDIVSLACVSKQFYALTTQFAKQCPPEGCFGRVQWEKYGAKVGEEPSMIPIALKLYQDCAKGLFMCTFIPETINREPLTLSSIDRFVGECKSVKKSNFAYPLAGRGISDDSVKKFKSHWVILAKDVLEGTRGNNFEVQKDKVERSGFEVPGLIDVIASLLLHNLRTGEFIYSDGSNGQPWTYTRVQEAEYIIVGGFSASGLHLLTSGDDDDRIGVACALKSIDASFPT